MTRAGLAKVEITCFEPGMILLGWGQLEQRARGVGTPLFARALVLESGEARVAMVAVELLFVSTAVRDAVLERLAADGFGPHQVMLAATHTHSGPSGFTQYLGYNASNFGFSKHVFDTVVDGIVRAVRTAHERLEEAVLRVGSARIPDDDPVAFNRSPRAYNQNADTAPIDELHPERATHREVVTLRVDAPSGEPLGLATWFGVHGSSFHADHQLLEADNKGIAAARFEGELRERAPGFVAVFFQEAAGDVSPNFRPDPRRGVLAGGGCDDRQSALENGEIQHRHARRAWESALDSDPLAPRIEHLVEHVDFGETWVGDAKTTPPVMGLPMAAGTAEGPGPLRPLAPALRALSRLARRKLPWLSADRGAEGRFLGVVPMRLGLRLVAKVEPRIAFVWAAERAGAVGEEPWLPRALPLQLLRIGELAIVAVPLEPTTVAGRRVRAALEGVKGASRVVVTSYANGYGGYVTTPEEYRAQHYEGGATLYGERTLPALVAELTWMARGRCAAPHERVLGPPLRPRDEALLLAQRRVGEAWLRSEREPSVGDDRRPVRADPDRRRVRFLHRRTAARRSARGSRRRARRLGRLSSRAVR